MKKTRIIAIGLVLVMLASLFVGCAPKAVEAPAETPATTEAAVETPAAPALKAALLVSGLVNDGGYNQNAYEGLKSLEAKGWEIAFTERVAQADQANTLRDYVKKGFNLILGNGYEYGDAMTQIGAESPEVYFAQIGGGAGGTQPNITSGFTEGSEGGYLAGILASKITKSNKIGFVGAMEIPTIVEAVDFFAGAVKVNNPSATVTKAYTGSWDDINKGKEAALAQIATGCDVIMGIGDAVDVGAIQACQEKGVTFIGFAGDFNKLAPDTVVTSIYQNSAKLVNLFADMVSENKFEAVAGSYGVDDEIVYFGEWSANADPTIKAEVLAIQDKIISGELTKEMIIKEIGYTPR